MQQACLCKTTDNSTHTQTTNQDTLTDGLQAVCTHTLGHRYMHTHILVHACRHTSTPHTYTHTHHLAKLK